MSFLPSNNSTSVGELNGERTKVEIARKKLTRYLTLIILFRFSAFKDRWTLNARNHCYIRYLTKLS